MSSLYKGAPVRMVDRYAQRAKCTCKHEPSWFDGMVGKVTQVEPYVMVHIENERLPMRFDERDFDVLHPDDLEPNLTGAE